MPGQSVDSCSVGTWYPLRVGSLAMAVLMLVTACATRAPYRQSVPHDSPEAWELESETDGEALGEAVFSRLPTDFAPVQVSDSEVTAALTALWLDTPLRVATSRAPLYVGRRLALASVPVSDEAWHSDLARSYGRHCERCGTPGDCLTLFEDGPRFQDDDKRRLALALAVGPALEGLDTEMRAMLDPTRLLTMLSISIAGYMALASKAPKLPGFAHASRSVEASTGLRLMDVATGAERLIVSVPEGTLRIVAAPHVVAMTARSLGAGSPAPGRGRLLPNGHRAWGSYNGFKSAMGSAGQGKEWHHIVERTRGNVKRFGGEALHNTENITALDKTLHINVSRLYSSIRWRITGSHTMTVRQWLSTQSYEAQREFGLLALTNVRNGVW